MARSAMSLRGCSSCGPLADYRQTSAPFAMASRRTIKPQQRKFRTLPQTGIPPVLLSSLLDSRFMSDATNSLSQASSAYLRSAMHQPIQWQEWGEEAFATAQRENKPILLDIGAVWCHWCHVMDRESYENEEIARLINEHYIAIKVDRDERPDIDARYQVAVNALTGQGGWPLTAFLTPEGKPFYGGTYFPPEDLPGRPGMARVLDAIAHNYRTHKTDILASADQIAAALN